MTSGIYIITNIKTSQVYIGSSKNIESRFNQHKSALRNGSHHSPKLQKAWNEYGEECFSFCLLQEESINLVEIEQQFIDNYKAWQGYNVQKKAYRGDDVTENPICPYCHNPMNSNGTQTSGANVYRCRRGCKTEDGKIITKTISDRPSYRLGEKSCNAKSQKQRDTEWKERDPIGYEAARLRKQANRKAKAKAKNVKRGRPKKLV